MPFGFILNRETEVFVIFRGTMNPAEWISNFKAVQEPFLDEVNIQETDDRDPFLEDSDAFMLARDSFIASGDKSLGEVHRGFYRTYTRKDRGRLVDLNPKNDRPSMSAVVKKTIEGLSNSQVSQIFVAGHSLGGALATLAALHIYKEKASKLPSPILYTFASPRVGDQKFAQNFNNLECYRIANSEDIVPTIPLANKVLTLRASMRGITQLWTGHLSELDYQHVGEPLYFASQNGSVSDNHIIPAYDKALS